MIKIDNISKLYYQGDTMITAVNHVSVQIQRGKFTSIVGPSGCGKSTLLNMMSGLLLPTDGIITIDGTQINNKPEFDRCSFRLKNIGYIYQDFGLVPIMTAYENICVPYKLQSRKPDVSEIYELCDVMGVTDRLHHLPSEMSGGERQRVAIVRALIGKPPLLLADEPTGNLDKENANRIMDYLLHVQKHYHQTMVLVTHDLSLANRADVILTMEDGGIVGKI